MPAADFLAVRFTIAALAMALLFRRQTLALSRRDLRLGVVLGGLYGTAQVLQTIGLQHTDASVSGFVTGTYVVLTPVLAWVLFRDRIGRATWVAVGLTTLGLAVLSLRGVAVGFGEALTLASAVFYALHIIALGRWSTPAAAVGLSTVQAGTIALISIAGALPGGITMPQGGGQWASVLYMALVAGAGALWAQTWAQGHLTATRAAIVMSMEPVFAAVFAVGLRRGEPHPPDGRRRWPRPRRDVPRRAARRAPGARRLRPRGPPARGAPPRGVRPAGPSARRRRGGAATRHTGWGRRGLTPEGGTSPRECSGVRCHFPT